jgi:taurine dioxygenase
MASAYDALSPALQHWLETLTAVHTVPPGYRQAIGLPQYPKEIRDQFEETFAAKSHPVVVRHPVNGRKLLFVNPAYTVVIERLNRRESHMLLRFLFNHLARPDFVYRHRWSAGDFVIWDELATLHLAPEDFAPHPRRVVRVTSGLVTPTAANPAAIAQAAEQLAAE